MAPPREVTCSTDLSVSAVPKYVDHAGGTLSGVPGG
jgi:hypothetical protein